jgi:hypothetical protein
MNFIVKQKLTLIQLKGQQVVETKIAQPQDKQPPNHQGLRTAQKYPN